jgi:hypothetical protein
MDGSQGMGNGGQGSHSNGWGIQQQGAASGSSGSSYQAANGNNMSANQPLHFSQDHGDVQQKDSQVGPMRTNASSKKSNTSEDMDGDAGNEDVKAKNLANPPVKAACTFCRSR